MTLKWLRPLPSYKTWREHRRLMRLLRNAPQPVAPDGLRERLLGPLADEDLARSTFRSIGRWQVATGMAVIALVALGIGTRLWPTPSEPKVARLEKNTILRDEGSIPKVALAPNTANDKIPPKTAIKTTKDSDARTLVRMGTPIAANKPKAHVFPTGSKPLVASNATTEVTQITRFIQPLMVVSLSKASESREGYSVVSGSRETGSQGWVRTELTKNADSSTVRSKQEASVGDPAGSFCKVIIESDVKAETPKGGNR